MKRFFTTSVKLLNHKEISIIKINDGKMNSFSFSLLNEIQSSLKSVPQSSKAILIQGNENAFSAGFDLSVMLSGDKNKTADLIQKGSNLALDIYKHKLPIVAASSGHSLAMGAILLLACDLRLGWKNTSQDAKRSKYGLNEVNIGMRIPIIGLELAKKKMSPRNLDLLLAQGRILSVNEACGDAGYLDEVFEGESYDDFIQFCISRTEELGNYIKQPAHYEIKRDLREDILSKEEEFKKDIDLYRL
eukprot:maker-scaffold_22-snap-gene-2.54-mRNA-1 protein AED:0.00 eAED:0.00 QI:87/1/1/1/1/1/2/132/245